MKNIYFMHIPKTGGRYIEDTIFYSLNIDCKRNNINTRDTIKSGHFGWDIVNHETFTLSFVRNPVFRTISHIIFYNPFFITENQTESKINILDYLNSQEAQFLINYQSKFICSTDTNMYQNFYKNFNYNTDLLESRISSINHLSRTEEISDTTLSEIYIKLCKHLEITPNLNHKVFIKDDPEIFLNNSSISIFNNLSLSEKNMIENINYLDMDLWESII